MDENFFNALNDFVASEGKKKKNFGSAAINPCMVNFDSGTKNVRIICNLPENEYNPVKIHRPWITDDQGKRFRVTYFDGDTEFIIPKILFNIKAIVNIVKKKDKVKNSDFTKKVEAFLKSDGFKNAYNIVYKNRKKEGDVGYEFEKGWNSPALYVANVLDRDDPNFEHSKILVNSESSGTRPNGSPVTYYEYGISAFPFEKACEEAGVTNLGNTDISISMNKPVKGDANWFKNNSIFTITKHDVSPLTEDEKTIKFYNLLNMFKRTSYETIFKRLRTTLMELDKVFNTGYFNFVKNEMEKELATKVSSPTSQEVSSIPNVSADEIPEEETQPVVKKTEMPVAKEVVKEAAPTGDVNDEDDFYRSLLL